MKKVDVKIIKNGTIIKEAKDRYIRLCPDGSLGVVYRKKVYRLSDENTIDINDQAVDKTKCPIATERQLAKFDDKSANVDLKWYLETNKFGHYIVFNGNEILVGIMLGVLDSNKIEWLRADKSGRKSDNGVQYDWFIRLKSREKRSRILSKITNILNDAYIEKESGKKSSNEDLLEKKDKEILKLKQDLAAYLQHQETLKLRAEFAEYERALVERDLSNIKENDIDRIEELKSEYKEAIKESEDLAYEEIEKRGELEEQVEILTQKLESMETKSNSSITLATIKMDTINLISNWLLGMYPKLLFDEESFDIIANEYSNYGALFHQLSLFVYDRKNFKSKNIKSIDGWNEFDCHIATGRNKNGRIYYRSHPTRSKYDYFIWVRMKRAQKKDFARMKSFNKHLTSA